MATVRGLDAGRAGSRDGGSGGVTTPEASRRTRAFALASARHVGAVAALLACTTAAHAGLFDDDEARRAIIDLRCK